MELAAHWHRCQNLPKTSEYFLSECYLQQYTGGELILSRKIGKMAKLWTKLILGHLHLSIEHIVKRDLIEEAFFCIGKEGHWF